MMNSDDRLRLLPAIFKNNNRKVEVNSVFIKLKSQKSGPCQVKCYIDWTETLNQSENKYRPTESTSVASSSIESSKSSCRYPTTTSTARTSQKTTKFTTTSSSNLKKSDCTCERPKNEDIVRRECDGICGRVLPVKQLFLMGQCEHAVCSRCLENAPRIENCFGALGCPNTKCYQLDVAALCPDKAKRLAQIRKVYSITSNTNTKKESSSKVSKSTSNSSITYENLNANGRVKTPNDRENAKKITHPVTVMLAIFRDASDGTSFLQKLTHELPSTISIGAALKSCISESAELSGYNLNNRCYVGPNSFIKVLDRATWNMITIDDDEPLYKLEDDDMRVMLVIDLVGFATRSTSCKSRKKRSRKH